MVDINKGNELFKKGILFLGKKKFRKARKAFSASIKNTPDYDLAWFYKAIALIGISYENILRDYFSAKKYFKEAKVCLDKSLGLNPKNGDAWIYMSEVLSFIGTYEEAIRCCLEALKLEPYKYLIQTAQVHERFKRYKEALECVEKVLTLDPSNKIAQQFKILFTDGLKYGSHFYIPSFMFGPLIWERLPREEIVYITSMSGVRKRFYSTVRGNKVRRTYFNAIVLCSRSGFIFSSKRFKPTHMSWSDAKFTKFGKIKIGKVIRDLESYTFELQKCPFFESDEEYLNRRSNFYQVLFPTPEPTQQIEKEDCPKCYLSRKMNLERCVWCHKIF